MKKNCKPHRSCRIILWSPKVGLTDITHQGLQHSAEEGLKTCLYRFKGGCLKKNCSDSSTEIILHISSSIIF